MPRIAADQYVQFERYHRGKAGKLSRVQLAQVDLLKELDDKCKRCLQFPDDRMHCEGLRLIFQPDIDPTRLVLEKCHKLDAKLDNQEYSDRLLISGLTTKRMRDVAEAKLDAFEAVVERKQKDLYFDGVKLEPVIYETSSNALVLKVWSYLAAMANQGFQGIYFLTIDYYRVHVKQDPKDMLDMIAGRFINCDWLVIDALDYPFSITYVRESLFTLVKTRIAHGKHTMLIVSKQGPQWETIEEKEFFEEAKKWPKLNLP